MKIPFQILIFVFFLTAFTSTAVAQTKEEIKRTKEIEKEQKRKQKQEEKEKLQRPAQIIINARPERVRAAVVGRAASQGSMIEEATDNRIVITQRVGGWRGAVTQALIGNAYSDEPKYRTVLFLAEVEKGKTLITISEMVIAVRMPLGNENKVNYTKNKKLRVEADRVLQALKERVEMQEQETAVQEKAASNSQSPPQSILSAEGYGLAGIELFKQKKYAEAETAFRQAIRLDTYNAAFHYNLSTALHAQGKFDEAEKEAELATRLAPNEETYKKGLEVIRANKNSRTAIKAN